MARWRRFLRWLDTSSSFRGSGLADETDAFLDGALLESLRAGGGGGGVPPWIWLNALAHADAERIAWLASERQSGAGLGWRAARARLAGELLTRADGDPQRLATLQHDVLVPLELAISDRPDITPSELVEVVIAELELAQHSGD